MLFRYRGAFLATSRLPGSLCGAVAPLSLSMASCSSSGASSHDSQSSSSSPFPTNTPGKVHVRIRTSDANVYERIYEEGGNLMEAIRDDATLPVNVPGACNGTSKCSTCQVIPHSPEWASTMSRFFAVTAAEQDCLDKAPDASEMSRLSCQITLLRELNGLEIDLPESTVDVRWQAPPRRSPKG